MNKQRNATMIILFNFSAELTDLHNQFDVKFTCIIIRSVQ